MRLPKSLVLFRTLSRKFCWARQRKERFISILKLLQPAACLFLGLIDAVDLDTMAGTRDMQPPIPGGSHKGRLRVERVVPASHRQLYPSFMIDRQINVPCSPRELVLLA